MSLITTQTLQKFQDLLDIAISQPRFRSSRMYHQLASLSRYHGLKSKAAGFRGRRAAPSISRWGRTQLKMDLMDMSHLPERDDKLKVIDYVYDKICDISTSMILPMFCELTISNENILVFQTSVQVPSPACKREDFIDFLISMMAYLTKLRVICNLDLGANGRFQHSRQSCDVSLPFYIVGSDTALGIDGILSSRKTKGQIDRELARFKRSPQRYPDVRIETYEAYHEGVPGVSFPEPSMSLGDLLRKRMRSEEQEQELVRTTQEKILASAKQDLIDRELMIAAGISSFPVPSFDRAVPTEAGGSAVKADVSGNPQTGDPVPDLHHESDFRAHADQQYWEQQEKGSTDPE